MSPRPKGFELEPHLHEDERLTNILKLYDSCSKQNNECRDCPLLDTCVSTYEIMISWSQSEWKTREAIWNDYKAGVLLRDIADKHEIGRKAVAAIIKEKKAIRDSHPSQKEAEDGGG